MTIVCIECGERRFEVNPNDVENVGIITFVCPKCGATTAVERRNGGGVTVGKEDRSRWEQQPR